jgi:hypothetical protein
MIVSVILSLIRPEFGIENREWGIGKLSTVPKMLHLAAIPPYLANF